MTTPPQFVDSIRHQPWIPATCSFCAKVGVTTPMQIFPDDPPKGEDVHWTLRCPIHVKNDHVILVALNARSVTKQEIEPAVEST